MAAPMARALRGLRTGVGRCWGHEARGGAGRSRLYEHVRDGNSAWPQLDVEALRGRQEEAERELEERKGPLRAHDLREIVSGGASGQGRGWWAGRRQERGTSGRGADPGIKGRG